MPDLVEVIASESAKPGEPPPERVLRFFKNLGPGLITGAADDDPSGISTYSVTGATTGLSMLWVALLTAPMMAVIQGMCARIGMVTGIGLAAQMRLSFPRWLAMTLALIVVIANTFNVGADFAGMAASANMVIGLPVLLWVVFFGTLILIVQIYLSYRVLSRIFKWLTLTLFAYVITAFIVHPNWPDVLKHTVIPELHFNGRWITTLVGVFGTTISPYLFFWQASLMVEEEKQMGRSTVAARRGATKQEIVDMHADVNTGMILSNLIMFFIITATAVTLYAHGKHDIATAQDAAQALRPLAGNFAYILFAVGMIGTGMLAIPVLAGSSAYVAAEMLRFREGLNESPSRAPRFYAILAGGVIIGVVMNVIRVDPIKALFWSAVLNGVAAVPLLYAVVHLASSAKVMGEWKSSLTARVWGWLTFVFMAIAAALMFVFWNQQ